MAVSAVNTVWWLIFSSVRGIIGNCCLYHWY